VGAAQTVQIGARADLVLLDQPVARALVDPGAGHVRLTMIGGTVVFEAGGGRCRMNRAGRPPAGRTRYRWPSSQGIWGVRDWRWAAGTGARARRAVLVDLDEPITGSRAAGPASCRSAATRAGGGSAAAAVCRRPAGGPASSPARSPPIPEMISTWCRPPNPVRRLPRTLREGGLSIPPRGSDVTGLAALRQTAVLPVPAGAGGPNLPCNSMLMARQRVSPRWARDEAGPRRPGAEAGALPVRVTRDGDTLHHPSSTGLAGTNAFDRWVAGRARGGISNLVIADSSISACACGVGEGPSFCSGGDLAEFGGSGGCEHRPSDPGWSAGVARPRRPAAATGVSVHSARGMHRGGPSRYRPFAAWITGAGRRPGFRLPRAVDGPGPRRWPETVGINAPASAGGARPTWRSAASNWDVPTALRWGLGRCPLTAPDAAAEAAAPAGARGWRSSLGRGPITLSGCGPSTAARDWSLSGAMALTGQPDGPVPLAPGGPAKAGMRAAGSARGPPARPLPDPAALLGGAGGLRRARGATARVQSVAAFPAASPRRPTAGLGHGRWPGRTTSIGCPALHPGRHRRGIRGRAVQQVARRRAPAAGRGPHGHNYLACRRRKFATAPASATRPAVKVQLGRPGPGPPSPGRWWST